MGFRLRAPRLAVRFWRSASAPALLLLGVSLGGQGLAQEAPDAEWGTFPGQQTPPPPPSPPPAPEPVRVPLPVEGASRGHPVGPPEAQGRPRPPEAPNQVSMLGAPMLGQWKRGQVFLLGFPLLQLRASIGLAEVLDVGLGFDSFYGTMNEPLLAVKVGGLRAGGWTFAASLEAGWAFFTTRASREVRGPRWITGQRNGNLSPAVLISFQGEHPRATRLFIELRYTLTFDTEPFSSTPLSGVPPPFLLGHNAGLRVGAELPLSARTSFVFLLGLMVHTRPDDSPVMPSAAVGVVTGL